MVNYIKPFLFLFFLTNVILIVHSVDNQQDSVSTETIKDESSEKIENYEYKAEVTRLLDIIINYLYTQKDRFMREIISNSVDALEKIRLQSLGNTEILGENQDLFIKISVDKEKQTISIFDSGIGMTKSDLINNLGTIAKSGTTNFLEAMANSGDINLIGQFGVGFYSAFLVADKVTVYSKSTSDNQYIWESKADTGFDIKKDPEGNTLGRGTKIVLHIKQDATEFLDVEKIEMLVQKFSQFMPYPIYLWKEKTIEVPPTADENVADDKPLSEPNAEDNLSKEPLTENEAPVETEEGKGSELTKIDASNIDVSDDDENKEENKKPITKTVQDWEHINTQKPIWMRPKSEVTDDDYITFYETITKDKAKPLSWVHFSAEGEIDFKALIYIPTEPKKDVYESYANQKTEIKLYSRRVLVADYLDVIPKFLAFITGIIDSDDIPLNVAREQLQEAKILRAISKKVVRKIVEMLKNLMKSGIEEREKMENEVKELPDGEEKKEKEKKIKEPTTFEKFWEKFGALLQVGCYEDETNSKKVLPILQYKTNLSGDKYITLDNYVDKLTEKQTAIYYITGDDIKSIKQSPFLQKFNKNNIEVLFAPSTMSEACLQKVANYRDKTLTSIQKAEAEIPEDEEEKTHFKKLQKHYKPLIKWFSKLLKGKVKSVELSKTLVSDPCAVVTTRYGYSATMEKAFKAQSFSDKNFLKMLSSMKIFQINPHHPLIKSLLTKVNEEVVPNNTEEAKDETHPEVEHTTDNNLEEIGKLLYDGALVASGYEVDDVRVSASNIYSFLSKASGIDPNTPIVEVDVSHITDAEAESTEDEAGSMGIDPSLPSGINPMDFSEGLNEDADNDGLDETLAEQEIPDSFSSLDPVTGKPKTEEFEKNLEEMDLKIKEKETLKDEL